MRSGRQTAVLWPRPGELEQQHRSHPHAQSLQRLWLLLPHRERRRAAEGRQHGVQGFVLSIRSRLPHAARGGQLRLVPRWTQPLRELADNHWQLQDLHTGQHRTLCHWQHHCEDNGWSKEHRQHLHQRRTCWHADRGTRRLRQGQLFRIHIPQYRTDRQELGAHRDHFGRPHTSRFNIHRPQHASPGTQSAHRQLRNPRNTPCHNQPGPSFRRPCRHGDNNPHQPADAHSGTAPGRLPHRVRQDAGAHSACRRALQRVLERHARCQCLPPLPEDALRPGCF